MKIQISTDTIISTLTAMQSCVQSILIVSLLLLPGVLSSSSEPQIVFTHDTTNQIGNVYEMMETVNGSIAVAGYYGIVFFDRDYNVTRSKKFNGAFLNIDLARFAEGIGVVGYNNKPVRNDIKIPHLLFVEPDLAEFKEVELCDSCSNIGVADFNGDGVDSVVVSGDEIFILYDLSNRHSQEVSKSWFDTRLVRINRVTETDFDCDGREELFFRAGIDSVLEHDNEWRINQYFILFKDGNDYRLTNYRTYLQNNWRQVRQCDSRVKTKDPLKLERYFENVLTLLSPGNVGRHYTDSPVQKFLKLLDISGAEEQSWEVLMPGMRRALNFYPLVDTDCIAANSSGSNSAQDCSRYLSVYARYGHGCEQFFWENEDCGTWALLLHPNGSWKTLATWPNWSFSSLLTSDGRLLFHSVVDLVEVKLPENLVRTEQ